MDKLKLKKNMEIKLKDKSNELKFQFWLDTTGEILDGKIGEWESCWYFSVTPSSIKKILFNPTEKSIFSDGRVLGPRGFYNMKINYYEN